MGRGRSRKVLAWFVVTGLAAVSLPALSAASGDAMAAAEGAPPQLKGKTTVIGKKPASIPVRLTERAKVATPFGSSPDLKVAGKGRFIAFALVPKNPKSIGLFGARTPKRAASQRILLPLPGTYFDVLKYYPSDTTLSPGDYRLYLLPDGKPTRVTLRLRGLSGSTTVRPKLPADYTVTFPQSLVPGGVRNYYSGGDEGTLRSAGLMFQLAWLRVQAPVAGLLTGVYHFCANGGEFLPKPLMYGPGCAGSGGGLASERRVKPEKYVKLLFQGIAPLQAGTYGQGIYYISGANIEDAGHITTWLSYEL